MIYYFTGCAFVMYGVFNFYGISRVTGTGSKGLSTTTKEPGESSVRETWSPMNNRENQ